MTIVRFMVAVLIGVAIQGSVDMSRAGTDSGATGAADQQTVPGAAAVQQEKIGVQKIATPVTLEVGSQLYQHYCSPCHGREGRGNGFNAARLLVRPANHTDAKFMSARSDQKLFDTINLGGVEVAKSTLMPPWGAALDDDNKIRALVLKLRDLCQCKASKNW